MRIAEFRAWMEENGIKTKVAGDSISRLSRIERELAPCDIDAEYEKDQCNRLLAAFANMGRNEIMASYPNAKLPIGKYYMSTYRHSLKQYIQFVESERK